MIAIKGRVRIHKEVNASRYLPCFDANVDGEFLNFVQQDDEDIYTILADDAIVGLAQAVVDRQGFIYVYIFPQHRREGFGRAAVSALEELLQENGTAAIQTCYRCGDAVSQEFAARGGYRPRYSSFYMEFSGKPWDLPALPIREYRTSDFSQAHRVCAEAFHLMRLGTGCFPDSVMEQPDEETEAYWAETAARRFVYVTENGVVGCVQLDGNEIASVAVKPSHQGNGIGTQLVKYAVNRLLAEQKQPVSLYCVHGNPAKYLYDTLGFIVGYENVYAEKQLRGSAAERPQGSTEQS